MSDQKKVSVHWSFWAISVVALLWNAMGGMNFLAQMNTTIVASMPETHQAIIIDRPIWATVGFALAVFGGAAGGLLLLLRKSAANMVFVVSLVGMVMTMLHTVNVSTNTNFSTMELFVMVVLPTMVAIFLVWYSKHLTRRGWIS